MSSSVSSLDASLQSLANKIASARAMLDSMALRRNYTWYYYIDMCSCVFLGLSFESRRISRPEILEQYSVLAGQYNHISEDINGVLRSLVVYPDSDALDVLAMSCVCCSCCAFFVVDSRPIVCSVPDLLRTELLPEQDKERVIALAETTTLSAPSALTGKSGVAADLARSASGDLQLRIANHNAAAADIFKVPLCDLV